MNAKQLLAEAERLIEQAAGMTPPSAPDRNVATGPVTINPVANNAATVADDARVSGQPSVAETLNEAARLMAAARAVRDSK